jgi:hypothetical protein
MSNYVRPPKNCPKCGAPPVLVGENIVWRLPDGKECEHLVSVSAIFFDTTGLKRR